MKFSLLKLFAVIALISIGLALASITFQSDARRLSIQFVSEKGGDVVYQHGEGTKSDWKLRSVVFASTDIKNRDLIHVKHINPPELIDLSNTKIDDSGLPFLYGVKAKTINLSGTNVTRDGVVALLGSVDSGCRVTWDGEADW